MVEAELEEGMDEVALCDGKLEYAVASSDPYGLLLDGGGEMR